MVRKQIGRLNLVPSSEWAKHLRPDGKRRFWHSHRRAEVELSDDKDNDFLEELWREHEHRS